MYYFFDFVLFIFFVFEIWKNVKVQYGSVNLPYYNENKGVIKNSVVDCKIAAETEAYGITKSNSNMLYNNIVKGNLVVSYGEAASMVSYGERYSKIENCTNYANVTAKRAAGIIDYNYGDVINCNNYGIVKGTEVEGDILIGNTEQKVPTASPIPTPLATPIATAIPSPTPVIVPDIVKTVKAIKTSNNNVRLSWNKLGKCHYQIWRSEGGNHKYQLLIQVDSRASYVDSQVKGGKTYYYKIVPVQNGWIIGSLAKAKEVKVKTDWLKRPTISVKIKKKKQRQYIEVKLLSFGGKYAQIQVKKGKQYRNITLTKKSISSVQKRYRLGYKKGGITLWVRVRTWQKIGGKKRYSAYSKAKKIRTV